MTRKIDCPVHACDLYSVVPCQGLLTFSVMSSPQSLKCGHMESLCHPLDSEQIKKQELVFNNMGAYGGRNGALLNLTLTDRSAQLADTSKPTVLQRYFLALEENMQ